TAKNFLAVAWRFILLIAILIVLAIFVAWRNQKKAKEQRLQKKQQVMGVEATPQKSQSKAGKQRRRKQAPPKPVAKQSERFDDVLFPDDDNVLASTPILEDDDDPLAELYAAREEAILAGEIETTSDPSPIFEEEEEVVDLASLLTTMAEDPKDYHTIADDPVAVRLITKKIAIADELLTIMRDDRDGRLMVQLGDNAYRTLKDDASARKQFTRIMKELSNVIMTEDTNSPDSVKLSGEQPNKMVTELIDVPVASGGDTQAREMISVLRDTADGHLLVQIGNTGYRSLIEHDRAKAGFAKIMKDLSSTITTPDDNPPVAPQKNQLQTSQPLPAFGSPIMSEDGTTDEPLPGDIRLPSMDDMPDSYSVGRFGRVRARKVKESEKVGEINIADAIEEYLQYKISQTPQFQGRGIHIRSGFGGGVRIDVDGQTYEFVDEVADKDAQAFIKQAIDEWQERH
ncbi:MAG: hypothetical protein AAFV93_08910, partial [Chloroflexota bacterium]